MAEGERSESLGEGNLAPVIEALVPEEDHAMGEEGLAYRCDRLVVQRLTGVHAANFCADAAGETFDSETFLCTHDRHGCASSPWF